MSKCISYVLSDWQAHRKVIKTGSSLAFKEFQPGRGQFHLALLGNKIRNHEPQSVQPLRIKQKPVPCVLHLSPLNSTSDHISYPCSKQPVEPHWCLHSSSKESGTQLFIFSCFILERCRTELMWLSEPIMASVQTPSSALTLVIWKYLLNVCDVNIMF